VGKKKEESVNTACTSMGFLIDHWKAVTTIFLTLTVIYRTNLEEKR